MTVFAVLYAVAALTTMLRQESFAWIAQSVGVCFIMAVVFMSSVFLVARAVKRYDLVDAAWGSVFIVIAITAFVLQPGEKQLFDLSTLVTLLVMLWGGRLTWHILRRIRNTKTEDPRYVELRKSWNGNVAANVYVRIYLLQAVLALLICVPVLHINLFAGQGVPALSWIGVAVWLIGYAFEVIGDAQLRRFISQPKNKGHLMTKGLWRYSRHPNYFGELTQWWGIFFICLTVPLGWVGIIGPVLISYLILYVSGIPLNEKRFEGRSGWKEYKARTSALIPLRPRS